MRLLLTLCLLPVVSLAAMGQTPPSAVTAHADLVADKLTRTDNVLRGQGHARAKIGDLAIQADEAAWHSDTGELELHGHVQVTLPARSDHRLFRYGKASLVTDKPVELHADRLTVANDLLVASGNLVIRLVDTEVTEPPQLQGDEMRMSLKIADATVRGNIRTTNIAMPGPEIIGWRIPRSFPPEIIK